jgi:hypothetical protein
VPTSSLFFADSPSVSDWPPGDKHTNIRASFLWFVSKDAPFRWKPKLELLYLRYS